MLKALELFGFKSFADKTRFEFPRGITVIVGPNGSGKSNVVDAIKWVLGEQSVKSLRGKEMADVIFNGSGSRKPVNAAEATLTFDNSDRLLAIDTPEVHITRRVYRSGEGEYLINRQPCRLRDIRDLFAGTGAATEAYSVIEQGKVDVLLQSSPKDRRVIFEEAAGISRFKAKKVEATRRLERVDQNLLRLSDIVDEVENRLRNVRLQATKARRYKEHTDRLQSLRTQVGLADWRALGQQLHSVETALAALHDERDQSTAALEAGEAQSLAIETALATLDESLRQCEAQIARNRERIATHESNIDHQRSRLHDLEEEIGRHRRHLATMSTRAGNLEQQARQTGEALAAAQIQFDQAQSRLAADEQVFSEVTARLAAVRESTAAMRATHMDRMRCAAMLGNQITGLESQESTAQRTSVLRAEQIEELSATQRQVNADLGVAREKLQSLEASAAETAGQLKAQQTQLADGRRQLTKLQKELTQLEGRHTGAIERAAVLEELDKRLEGLNAGVKEVLLKAREATDGPFEQVRGLVADLLQVNVETAPLIEIALGELAQHLVVAPGRSLIEFLETEPARFPGRVGFLRLDVQPPASAVDRVNLDGQAGVVGRADRFVEAPAEFLPLVRRLLGRTWIVEKLSNAVALSEGAGRGLNFVTLAGELLSAEGTLAVGPRHTSTGLISRRSELRALRGVIAELASKIDAHQTALAALERQVCEADERVQQLLSQNQEVSSALAQQQLQTRAADERLTELNARLATLEAEFQSAVAQRDVAAAQLSSAKERLAMVEAEIADTEVRIQEAGEQLEQLETQRSQSSRQTTEERVGLARSEQQLDSLRRQMEQLTHDQQERSRALAESRMQLEQCTERAGQARQSILQTGAEVAELYLAKEQLTFDGLQRQLERDAKRLERTELGAQTQRVRHQVRTLEESIHAQDLVAGDLSHQRSALVQRLREDYDIELGELEHEPSAEEQREREAIEQEIADLRRKINNIGNVNLEALTELEELELRFGSLSAQHSDLTKAKGSLEQIIGRINSDSRRLFAETLEVVRGHFQALFRKLFGGGQADIVLEEGLDILDCGIEIVARPPGKEPRSISLLSGGEKTLTCVALLLAVFRSRPSPFCVLDEVDAALDEANIERFVSVVKDFLSWTQFIIVTHSKKTMTCASTLYGVTMQESGISKRVSVRFEDVSEDGRIHQSALDREKDDADASASGDETQAA